MRIDFILENTEVKKRDNGTYFVKLNFKDTGFYIDGIRVVPTQQDENRFVVYEPKILTPNSEYKTNYGYDKSKEFWLYLKGLALKAVDEYDATPDFDDIENVNIEKELGKAIDGWEGKSS